jgi:hypothetical protein
VGGIFLKRVISGLLYDRVKKFFSPLSVIVPAFERQNYIAKMADTGAAAIDIFLCEREQSRFYFFPV